jgi:hypothetical protein
VNQGRELLPVHAGASRLAHGLADAVVDRSAGHASAAGKSSPGAYIRSGPLSLPSSSLPTHVRRRALRLTPLGRLALSAPGLSKRGFTRQSEQPYCEKQSQSR